MTRTHETPTRHVADRLASMVLHAAAIGGAICIGLVIAGYAFGTSLIMFSTGSMAPTIPAGSVALVREVPATEIGVGDVVTVERPGQLPITHRVTGVLATSGDAVTFTMQGDANEDPDLEPYTATTVRTVLGSVPGAADIVVAFQDWRVLGGLALGVAALVTWAFWPRPDEEDPVDTGRSPVAATASTDDAAPSGGTPSPVRRRDLRDR